MELVRKTPSPEIELAETPVEHVLVIPSFLRDQKRTAGMDEALRLGDTLWGRVGFSDFRNEQAVRLLSQVSEVESWLVGHQWAVFEIDVGHDVFVSQARDYLIRPDGTVGWTFAHAPFWEITPTRSGYLRGTASGRSLVGKSITCSWNSSFRVVNDAGEEIVLHDYPDETLGVPSRRIHVKVVGRVVELDSLLAQDIRVIQDGCRRAIDEGLTLRITAP